MAEENVMLSDEWRAMCSDLEYSTIMCEFEAFVRLNKELSENLEHLYNGCAPMSAFTYMLITENLHWKEQTVKQLMNALTSVIIKTRCPIMESDEGMDIDGNETVSNDSTSTMGSLRDFIVSDTESTLSDMTSECSIA